MVHTLVYTRTSTPTQHTNVTTHYCTSFIAQTRPEFCGGEWGKFYSIMLAMSHCTRTRVKVATIIAIYIIINSEFCHTSHHFVKLFVIHCVASWPSSSTI